MTLVRHHGGWVIFASFALALMLTIVPLPQWSQPMRPEWTALVLIYWCMAIPDRVGVLVGWVAGLFLDVSQGALLGQHALGLSVVAYVILKVHQRLRVQPPWQQAGTVLMVLALHQLLVLWVSGLAGQAPGTWLYWLPSLTGTLLWPWTFLILRDARRRFRVS